MSGKTSFLYEALQSGRPVYTTRDAGSPDWAYDAGREHAWWGARGTVVKISDSHGLCALVRHSGFRQVWYLESELSLTPPVTIPPKPPVVRAEVPRADDYNAERATDLAPQVETYVAKILEAMAEHRYPITPSRPLRLPNVVVPADLQLLVAARFSRPDCKGWDVTFERGYAEVAPEREPPDPYEGNRG